MRRFWTVCVMALLAACSTAPPTPDIAAVVAATVSAERADFFRPELLAPADSTTFDNPSGVVLTWDWVRSLGDTEYFDVRVWKAGEPEQGITWSQETEFDLSAWLSQQAAGEFLWSVAVIAGQDGQVEAVVGEAAPARHFTLLDPTLPTPTPTPSPVPLEAEDMIQVPSGFEAHIFGQVAQAPTAITTITFTPEGDLLVLALDGRLWQLGDDDGDGVVDRQQQILFNDDPDGVRLIYAAGMGLYEDRIYVSEAGRVGYLVDADEDGVFDQLEVIIDDLPGLQYTFHSNNGIVFDTAGKLYVAVGATSDHGPLEQDNEASILRANADGTDLEVFATGFRNPFDIALAPDGRLFAGDNAPDLLDKDMPFYPPEELNYVREGRDYGFPNVYGFGKMIRPHDREWEAPVVELPTSSVTAGIAYYAADQFPEKYRDGIFIAQYGGFNKQGRKVIFVELQATDAGAYTGEWNTFATFLNKRNPVDLTIGPDGALYIAEWQNGYILRVTYVGE